MPRIKRKYEATITVGFTDRGKRIRKYIGADSLAEFERAKYQALKTAEEIRNPSDVTLGQYADKWFAVYKSNKTHATKEGYQNSMAKLKPLWHIPLKEIKTSDLQAIVNANADHFETCRKLKLTLHQIYRQAIKDGIIYPMNLADNLEIPPKVTHERRFITDAEMELISRGTYTEQDRLYLNVLRNTGMRPAEVLALQWGDIDFDKLEIRVCRALGFDGNKPVVKATKTNKPRTIPITQGFADRLSEMPKNGLFLFTGSNGRLITKTMYRGISKRILNEINRMLGGNENMDVLNGLTMYSFRHTYATNLYYTAVKTGIISTKMAAYIMGHSEQVFLRIYTHIDQNNEQMDKLRHALSNHKKGGKKETQTPKKASGDA